MPNYNMMKIWCLTAGMLLLCLNSVGLAGFKERENCELNLQRQGLGRLDAVRQCQGCFLHPELPICQGRSSGYDRNESSSGSYGRGSGSSGSSSGYSSSSSSGQPREALLYEEQHCLQFSTSSGGGITTVKVVNNCSKDWTIEDVCGKYGLVDYASGMGNLKVWGNSQTSRYCKAP